MAIHDGLLGGFSGLLPTSVDQFVSLFIWGFLGFGGFIFAIIYIRNKVKYKYRGEILKRRQDSWQSGEPASKILEGKAGYFKVKGISVFRINYGIMPWQSIDIKKLPDPKFMEDNKAYFLQYNVGELVQAKRMVDWENKGMSIIPVDSTTKDAAKVELKQYSDIFNTRSKLQENMGIAVLGFVLIAGIIAFYFVSRACGG